MNLHDIIFPQLSGKWCYLDLNSLSDDFPTEDGNPLLNPAFALSWIQKLHRLVGCDYSWGGYWEDRKHFLAGSYLTNGKSTHLGLDFTVPYGTSVYSPVSGVVKIAEHDKDQNGGWGGKVVVQTESIYCIFGHLTPILPQIGQSISRGDEIGKVAHWDENGYWWPHLHLQCVFLNVNPQDVDGYGERTKAIQQLFPNPIISL